MVYGMSWWYDDDAWLSHKPREGRVNVFLPTLEPPDDIPHHRQPHHTEVPLGELRVVAARAHAVNVAAAAAIAAAAITVAAAAAPVVVEAGAPRHSFGGVYRRSHLANARRELREAGSS